MPPRNWFIRLEDILSSIERIEESLGDIPFDEFERNFDKQDIVIRHLTVIGEAANHVPEEVHDLFPKIPWAKAVELRNFVVHEYFGITLAVIWDTIKNRLPDLKKEISDIVAQGTGKFEKVVVSKKGKKKTGSSRSSRPRSNKNGGSGRK